jgi:hypothetical protein
VNSTIYDANEGRPDRRFTGLFTLAFGIGLSAWYVRGIPHAIIHAIQTFPPSFKAMPILTVGLAVFMFVAYIAFGALLAMMIYIPACNLWFNKFVTGHIESTEVSIKPDNKAYVSIKLDGQVFTFKDRAGLKWSLREKVSPGDSVRFTIGAFGRVERVDKLN